MDGDPSDRDFTLGTENGGDDLPSVTDVECTAAQGKRVIQDWTTWTVGVATTSSVTVSFTPTEKWPVGKIKLVFRTPIGGGRHKLFPSGEHAIHEVLDLP